jgi:hypothetical protein
MTVTTAGRKDGSTRMERWKREVPDILLPSCLRGVVPS